MNFTRKLNIRKKELLRAEAIPGTDNKQHFV